jgi:hypothetical protein
LVLKIEPPVQKTETVTPKIEPVIQKPEPQSLSEVIEKETVSFSSRPNNTMRPKRKEVNLEELKKTLEESLEDLPEKPKDENPSEGQPKE